MSPSRLLPAAAALVAAALAAAPARAQAPDTEIFLLPLRLDGGRATVGAPVNVTARAGYDNQPSFTPDGRAILYTSQRDGQTDIYRYDLATRQTSAVTQTPESEYSAAVTPDGRSIAVVRVELDSTQRLWRFPLRTREAPQPILADVKPVGYYAWADPTTLALFVLGGGGQPNTLQVARLRGGRRDTLLTGIGRSLHAVPGRAEVSFVHAAASPRVISAVNPASGAMRRVARPLEGSEDFVWADARTLLMARDGVLHQLTVGGGGDGEWTPVADLAPAGIGGITRLAVSPRGDWLAVVGTPRAAGDAPAADTTRARAADVRAHLAVLAADSLEGRRTGTAGIARAAQYLAEQFRALGLEPAGDSVGAPWAAYLQRVPARWVEQNGARRPARAATRWADLDSVPVDRRLVDANVIGIIRGSDPALRDEAVVVTAHYDHLGVGRAGQRGTVAGDSIFNGADDDASGTVALLEIARQLKAGAPPKRTVIFAALTGEEVGLIGTRWYLDNPVVPLERTVANFNVEMIGRPDSLAGGAGKGWLTGYERSTMGEQLQALGIPLVPDPRPDQNFFRRSDNYGFALAGVPAHTLSSFGLHGDYHTVNDELETMDIAHMTRVIDAAARAVRLLADGERVAWKPGGRPTS